MTFGWHSWPDGWDRTRAFRVVNFLGVTGANTHQNVIGPNGSIFYCCRIGLTGELEIRFNRKTVTIDKEGEWHGAHIQRNKYNNKIVMDPYSALITQVLQITNI